MSQQETSAVYETLSERKTEIPKFSPLELGNFGLRIPMSRLTTALSGAIWATGNQNQGVKGILLFGNPGSGEDFLLDGILQQVSSCTVRLTFDYRKNKDNSAGALVSSLKRVFEAARNSNCRSITIRIADANSILFPKDAKMSACCAQLVSELYSTSQRTIFVIAHVAEPWNLPSNVLELFKVKIYISAPKEEARIGLLRFYLNEVSRTNGLKYSNLASWEYEEIFSSDETNGMTWTDLEKVAYKAMENAMHDYLGLRPDQKVSMEKLTEDQCKKMKEVLTIDKEHVQAALQALSSSSANYAEAKAVKFIKDWSIPQYNDQRPPEGVEEDFGYLNRKPKTWMDYICLCSCSCLETCC